MSTQFLDFLRRSYHPTRTLQIINTSSPPPEFTVEQVEDIDRLLDQAQLNIFARKQNEVNVLTMGQPKPQEGESVSVILSHIFAVYCF